MGEMYFAKDGSYGDATEMLIVPAFVFTDAEWEAIVEANDNDRLKLVKMILASR